MIAQFSEVTKKSGKNKISKICAQSFDGMNVALYIVLESIRSDECPAGKTSSDAKPSDGGSHRGSSPGSDIA